MATPDPAQLANAPQPSPFVASLRPRENRLPEKPEGFTVEQERRWRQERLAGSLRIFARLGYEERLSGHITARDPELPDHFWVNPLGRAFSRIRVSDLILVNSSGQVMFGDAPVNRAAFAIHSAIHAARPDVVAAAHAHSVYGKALAVTGEPLLPYTQDACVFYEDNVVVADFSGVVHEVEEGRRIAKHLGACRAAVLANHGLLTVGRSVEEAVVLYVTAERAAKTQVLARAAGKANLIPEEVARRTHEQRRHYGDGSGSFLNLWEEIVHEQPDLLL